MVLKKEPQNISNKRKYDALVNDTKREKQHWGAHRPLLEDCGTFLFGRLRVPQRDLIHWGRLIVHGNIHAVWKLLRAQGNVGQVWFQHIPVCVNYGAAEVKECEFISLAVLSKMYRKKHHQQEKASRCACTVCFKKYLHKHCWINISV